MNIEKELARIKPSRDTLFSIGVFDGVHIGHQHLLTHLKNQADQHNWLSGVITFKSHPEKVITSVPQPWLIELDERVNQIKRLGIDTVVILEFSQSLKQLTAREFLQLLKKYLRIRGLIVGPDFALGKNREGNQEKLRLLGAELDFTVEVMEPFILDGEVVSSSGIRQMLARGEVFKAARFLGRPFSLSGKPVSGDHRGRILGSPTINLEPKADMASPGDGVYVTISHLDRFLLPSVTNIGIRPTFGGKKRIIETHLLDYQGKLTLEKIEIDFIDKLRDEIQFHNADELKAQIAKDVAAAKALLEKQILQT